ncbi:MAG: DUF2231 domain-containing protein [Gemmatimonadales bacterium]|nr:DUF2231 domain-containing protein [Gemmatimonadales bacterium]
MLLLNGDGVATFLGLEFVRLHAMLNDLPAALLVVAVVFEALHVFSKKDGFRHASFWTLIAGTIGAAAAVLSGLQAEETIEHGTAIHEMMERHETLAFITLGVFAVLAGWRLVRERKMKTPERQVALVLALVGAGVLYTTSKLGGELVFSHAAGISTEIMQQEMENRGGGHEHEGGVSHEHPADSVPASPADSAGQPAETDTVPDHVDPPGAPPHTH